MVRITSSQLHNRKKLGENGTISNSIRRDKSVHDHTSKPNDKSKNHVSSLTSYADWKSRMMFLISIVIAFMLVTNGVLINQLTMDSQVEFNLRGRILPSPISTKVRVRPNPQFQTYRHRQVRLSNPEFLTSRKESWSSAHRPPAPLRRGLEPLWDDEEDSYVQPIELGKTYNSWVWERDDINDDDHLDSQYQIENHGGLGSSCDYLRWHHYLFPTCNSAHEIDIADRKIKIIGQGYYRNVWIGQEKTYVVKIMDYEHPFEIEQFGKQNMDALVMERLTGSPLVVDIYGHCGTTVFTEAVSEEIADKMVPGEGAPPIEGLNDTDSVDPQNDFTVEEKLTIGLEMVESLAELHGYKDGIIIHGDVQPTQWLRTSAGVLKINDFNRAANMMYWPTQESYCKYKNGGGYGNYRAPEENEDRFLDERLDVYSLGNNLYTLLTGLWNYYSVDDDEVAQELTNNHTLPFVDTRYRNHTYAEGALVRILERTWEFHSRDRADVFELVQIFRRAVHEQSSLVDAGQEQDIDIVKNRLDKLDLFIGAYNSNTS